MKRDGDVSVVSAADVRARITARTDAAAGDTDTGRTTPDRLMLELLEAARGLALAPVSGFRVGAVAQGRSGALYLGANLEFAGMPLGASVHAEQAAIANAWAHDEPGVIALAVTAAPCGHCRQFLNELGGAERLRVLIVGSAPATLADLLPQAFGPRDLGVSGGLLPVVDGPLQSGSHRLEPAKAGELIADPAVAAALTAAERSYAPYSKTYAGVALELTDGTVHAGSYAENAAFNRRIPPLQATLVRLALGSVPFDSIRRAVLVEATGPVSQRAATEALLAAIAPNAILLYHPAVSAEPVPRQGSPAG